MAEVDLDAQAVMFDGTGRVVDAAYYNQLSACNGRVTHSGDNRNGLGEDDEVIKVDFDHLPNAIKAIAIIVTAYSGGTFQSVETANMQVRSFSDDPLRIPSCSTSEVSITCRGNNTAFVFCVIYKDDLTQGKWRMRRVGRATHGKHFEECKEDVRAAVESVLSWSTAREQMLSTDQTFNMHKGDSATVPQALAAGELRLGLGWTTQQQNLDLDASCLMLTQDYSCSAEWTVYFGQKSLPGVTHGGDNLNGEGSGDDETILVDLAQVPSHIHHLAFTANIYSDGRTFAEVFDSYIRMLGPGGQILARYQLGEHVASRGLFFACFSRWTSSNWGEGWHFQAVGELVGGKRGSDAECRENVRSVLMTGRVPMPDPPVVPPIPAPPVVPEPNPGPDPDGEQMLSTDQTFNMHKGDSATVPQALAAGELRLGLGWTTQQQNLDLDASCLMLTQDYSCSAEWTVHFGQKSLPGVTHGSDNLNGEGSGDDETILVDLAQVPSHIHHLAFTANIYSDGRTFAEVFDSYIHMLGPGGQILARYQLGEHVASRGLFFACFSRWTSSNWGEGWHFQAVGELVGGKRGSDAECREAVRSVLMTGRVPMPDPPVVPPIPAPPVVPEPSPLPGPDGEQVLSTDQTFNMHKGDSATVPQALAAGELRLGLGWTTQQQNLDLDASCLMLTQDYSCSAEWTVHFGQKSLPGVTHGGDNLNGEGSGDDETILVDLAQVPSHIHHLAFTANIYSDGRTFAKVLDSYIRMLGPGGQVLARYQLGEHVASRGLFFACFSRWTSSNWGEGWHFQAVGELVGGKRGLDAECREAVRSVLMTGRVPMPDPPVVPPIPAPPVIPEPNPGPDPDGEQVLSTDQTFNMHKGDSATVPQALAAGELRLGLGWTTQQQNLDLDASCLMLTQDYSCSAEWTVHFGQKSLPGVTHGGDNLNGEGSGDDETILVDLAQVPSHTHHLAFTANIYSDGRTFAEVFDSYIRMLGPGGQVLARYQLGEHVASRGLFFACFSRWTSSNWGEGWHFQAVGELVGGKRGSGAECREAVRSVLMTGRVPMPDPPVVPPIPAPPVVPEPSPDPGPDGEQVLSTDQTFNMHKGDSATVPQALAAGELRLGLGWTTQQQNLDLDARCLMLTQDYSCSAEWTVHFGQKSLPGVTHGGDNLNGEGSGDDETILVDLAQVPSHIHHLAFTANIYSDGRTFAKVLDSYIRMLGPGGQILARYQLGEHVASRGLFFACFSRWTSSNWGEGWHFQAVGELVGGKRGSDAECRETVRSVLMMGRVPMPAPSPLVSPTPAPVIPEPNPRMHTDQTFIMCSSIMCNILVWTSAQAALCVRRLANWGHLLFKEGCAFTRSRLRRGVPRPKELRAYLGRVAVNMGHLTGQEIRNKTQLVSSVFLAVQTVEPPPQAYTLDVIEQGRTGGRNRKAPLPNTYRYLAPVTVPTVFHEEVKESTASTSLGTKMAYPADGGIEWI